MQDSSKKTETFTILRHDMLDSQACLLLPPVAFRMLASFRRLWMCLTRNERKQITAVEFTWFSCEYFMTRKTFAKHRDELIEKGFIDAVSKEAGFYRASERWRSFGPSEDELERLERHAQSRACRARATAQYREEMLRPKARSLEDQSFRTNQRDEGVDLNPRCRESDGLPREGVDSTQGGGRQSDSLSMTNSTTNTPPIPPRDLDDIVSTDEVVSIDERRVGDKSDLEPSKESRTSQSPMAREPRAERRQEVECDRAVRTPSPVTMPAADARAIGTLTHIDGSQSPTAPPKPTPMRQEEEFAAFEERRKQAPRELRAIFRQRITDEPYLSHQENFDIAEGLFQREPYYQFIVDWLDAERGSDGQSEKTKANRFAKVIRQHLEPHSDLKRAETKVLCVLRDPRFDLELVRDAVVGIICDVDAEMRSHKQTIRSPLSLLQKRTESALAAVEDARLRKGSELR